MHVAGKLDVAVGILLTQKEPSFVAKHEHVYGPFARGGCGHVGPRVYVVNVRHDAWKYVVEVRRGFRMYVVEIGGDDAAAWFVHEICCVCLIPKRPSRTVARGIPAPCVKSTSYKYVV